MSSCCYIIGLTSLYASKLVLYTCIVIIGLLPWNFRIDVIVEIFHTSLWNKLIQPSWLFWSYSWLILSTWLINALLCFAKPYSHPVCSLQNLWVLCFLMVIVACKFGCVEFLMVKVFIWLCSVCFVNTISTWLAGNTLSWHFLHVHEIMFTWTRSSILVGQFFCWIYHSCSTGTRLIFTL